MFCSANGQSCVLPVDLTCGNGIIDGPNEVCDDGNQTSGDGCSEDCRSVEYCGNGIKDVDEICDDGNNDSGDGCSSNCMSVETCGNGFTDLGEVCDDGNNNANDGCSADCQSDETCRNAIIDSGEQCDCGSGERGPREQSCAGRINSLSGGHCRVDCQLHCGDGVVNPEEACDIATIINYSCTELGYDFGIPSCSATCGEIGINACGNFNWTFYVSSVLDLAADIYGIWGTSSEDIWIWGAHYGDGDDDFTSLVYHFDGTDWTSDYTTARHSGVFHRVWGADANNIFAIGRDREESETHVTHYNGTAWNDVHLENGLIFEGLWGSSPDGVFMVGMDEDENSTLIMHNNGGTWSRMVTPPGEIRLYDVWGSTGENVYAVGQGGVILHYDGRAWEPAVSPTSVSLYAIWGSGADRIFAVGNDATVIWYNGEEWQPVPLSGLVGYRETVELRDIYGAGSSHVLIVGSKSSDFTPGRDDVSVMWDGHSWILLSIPEQGPMDRVWGMSEERFYAVARDHAGWLENHGNFFGKLLQVYDPIAVWVGPQGKVVVAESWYQGNRMVVLDGYSRIEHPIGAVTIRDIWGHTSSEVFAVGDNGVIFRYSGSSWSQMESGTTESLRAIWGTEGQVFAVGDNGTILQYRGLSWQRMDSGTSSALMAVSGNGAGSVFATGREGILLHFDGVSWQDVSERLSTEEDLVSVWTGGASDVLVADAEGYVWFYDGVTWRIDSLGGASPGINAVWGSSSADVFAVGREGRIYHRMNNVWGPVRVPGLDSAMNFTKIIGNERGDVYIIESGDNDHAFKIGRRSPW